MSDAEIDEELLQVCMVQPVMITEFKKWVTDMGWHLQGPVKFSEDDTPTYFLQPLGSQEELGEYLRFISVEEMQRDT